MIRGVIHLFFVALLFVPCIGAGQQQSLENEAPEEEPLPVFEVTHEIFKPDAHFQNLEFHFGQLTAEPKGILIIAEPKARPGILADPEWATFAKRMNWNVLVVGIQGTRVIGPDAVRSLDERLQGWIQAKAKKPTPEGSSEKEAVPGKLPEKVPPVHYFTSSGTAAVWMESLMTLNPKRFAAWAIFGSSRFAAVPKAKDLQYPPGCLVAINALQHTPHLDHFEDIRAGNKSNPVCFVSCALSGQHVVDSFARMFLEAAINAPVEQHQWLNVHTFLPHPADSKTRQDPVKFGWFPNAEILGAVQTLRPEPWPKPAPSFARRDFRTTGFASCELRWLKTVPKPKAILLIGNTLTPTSVRHMPEWIEYAKKREWAVLLMGLKEDKIRSEENAAKALESRLYKEIDALDGPESQVLPLITYAQGTAGTWLQTLMLRQPARYRAWVVSSTSKFPAVTSSIKTPPGMLIPQIEAHYRPQLHHFEDLRAADPYNPVCFLTLDDPKPPTAWVDGCVRSFIDGALSAKKEVNRWLHLHDLTPPSRSMTVKPDPKRYAWFPSSELVGLWKTLRKPTEAFPLPVIAKRTFKTKILEVPELKLFVRIPSDLKKGQNPNGVLCICTWQQEDTTLVNRLKNADDYLVKFADRQGLAIVTWNTANMVPKGLNHLYLKPEEDAELENKFTMFGEVWHDGLRKICNEFKLPDDGMLLYGISRGARFAHQISMRYPKRFLAVHTHIGNRYNAIIPREAKDTLWLVSTGEVDGGYGASVDFYRRGLQDNLPMLFKAGQSLGHSTRRDIEELTLAFFTYAIDLRDTCLRRRAKDRRANDAVRSLFAQQLAAPAYYGDLLNHEIMPAADAASWWVPESQRMALPTERIALAWGMTLEQATARVADVDVFAGIQDNGGKQAAPAGEGRGAR